MSRRRLVAIASACALLGVGLLVLLVAVSLTQTSYGRDQVRDYIQSRVASRVHGRMYIGRIGGGLLRGVTIDSLEIRDAEDSLFVASGPITIEYDPRDLIDKRIVLRHVTVERPVVRLRQHENDEWNYRRIFPKGPKGALHPERRFGDFILIDSADVRGGAFTLTLPWHPDDSLRGARRDSAVAYNLARADREVRRSREGLTRTWRWTGLEAALSYARITHPDSAGQLYKIADLRVAESDPPVRFRNVRGGVRVLKDSAWLDVRHFDLPASTGRARGKVVWGSHLPVRYAIKVVGDSVSLNDVAWVYPTLPRAGGGSMILDIRNQPRNLKVIDYALSRLDVRTTGSRLRGKMTFGVGGPVLVVKDVDLEADPVDFALLRHLNGKPFPVDWAGTLAGRVRGRGGPVNRFRVDDARVTFRDAHVPGAVTRAAARGELDILFPAFTVFRGFDVDVEQGDLRSIQHLYPNFPKLAGTVSGVATLDSSWLDVRFSRADVTHRHGAGPASRLTGQGRVTYGEEFMTYDVDLTAEALAFTTLARSWPALPLRGTYAGPIRAKGTVEALDLAARLAGPGGTLAVDGRFDLFAPGYAARGTGSVAGLDLRALLDRPSLPPSAITARVEADVRGDSLANLVGPVAVETERSLLDGVRVFPSRARVTLAAGRLRVDTLAVETAAAAVAAAGELGLARADSGVLAYRVTVDSLGGLRRWLGAPPAGRAAPRRQIASAGAALDGLFPGDDADPAADSLAGTVVATGTLAGTLDALTIAGALEGHDLFMRGHWAQRLGGSFSVADAFDAPRGDATLTLDTAVVAGVRLTRVGAELQMRDRASGRLAVTVLSENGPRAALLGHVQRSAGATAVALESLTVQVGGGAYRLAAPARLTTGRGALAIEPVTLRHQSAGWLALRGALPADGPADVTIAADSLSLADLGLLAQARLALDGRAALDVRVSGTRAAPEMRLSASLANARVGDARIERVTATGEYAGRRLVADVGLYRAGRRALVATASLPVDLALAPVRRRLLDEPLRGNLHTDSLDLAVIESFAPSVQHPVGAVQADVNLGGTWRRPVLTGRFAVQDGALGLANLGVQLRHLHADVALAGDSLHIRRLTAQSGEARADTVSVTGWVAFTNFDDPRFRLQADARGFHVIDRPRVASLFVSTPRSHPLVLRGSKSRATLTGAMRADRGAIFIPELMEKQVVDLTDPEFYDVVDTSLYRNRTLLPDAPGAWMENLAANVRVTIGDEVWLRSSEANIQLGGDLTIAHARNARGGEAQLALEGEMRTVRGTYRLNLGIVQPSFQVERGTLRFFGEPDLNPTLDISALHTVRQSSRSNRDDVHIRVTIGGTLAAPKLALSSADVPPIPESDLFSYLVTGEPAYALGGLDPLNTAASVGLRSLGSYVGSLASGGLIDVVEVQTGGLDVRGAGEQFSVERAGRDVLSNTRVGLGRQLGDRTFVSVNAGLCQIRPESERSLENLWEDLGWKVEHRFNHGFSAEAGVEPGTSQLTCARTLTGARSFTQTPRQFGFDLFRTWRF